MRNARRRNRNRPRKRPSRQNLEFGQLEDRKMFAVVGMTSTAVLDFDGEWMNSAQLQEGRWDTDDFNVAGDWVSFPSFDSLFNASRPWLDLNGNGLVNGNDAQLAINRIVDKVIQDFSPYDLDIVVGDQDDFRHLMGDRLGGDVNVIISGGADNTVHGNPNSAWAWSRLDSGNELDDHAFVFAGGSVDSATFGGNANQWLNQIARTISHEMGHTFGLEHENGDARANREPLSHSVMGTPNRDWTHDFSFHDRTYQTTVDGYSQNAHQYLNRTNILGASQDSWMAVLKPGQLTIHAAQDATHDRIFMSQPNPSQLRVNMNGIISDLEITATDTESFNAFNDNILRVNVYGKDGNDTISLDSSMSVRLFGYGGDGHDTLRGGAGADRLYGNSGDDLMFGGSGNDFMDGGSDNDRMYGNNESDRMYGGSGDDLMSGGSGNDRMYGGSNNDTMYGGSGADRMLGGSGADWMSGGSNNDTMYGGSGADRMLGSSGADWMSGGSDN